jgi:Protein of unknown function (DUF3592)
VWRWIQRQRANNWPTVSGEIQSMSVAEAKRFFLSTTPRRNSPTYMAELGYSYWAAGQVEVGFYKREFGTEPEGDEFVRDLRGKSVTVRYNPNKPWKSSLSESSVQTLLQTRPPKPETGVFTCSDTDAVPNGLRPFLWVSSSCCQPTCRQSTQKRLLKGGTPGLPDWMRYMVYGFFGYAAINFALFIAKAPTGGGGANPPPVVWRGFTDHWMVFCSAAMAILYSPARMNQTGVPEHPLLLLLQFGANCPLISN